MKAVNVIYTIGLVQGLYLMIALLSHQQGNKTANRWLVAFIGSFTVMTLAGITFESGIYEQHPWLFTSITGALYLTGPSIYFYTCTLIDSPRFRLVDLLHFAPFILYTGYMLYINSLLPDIEIIKGLKYLNKRHQSEPFVNGVPWAPIFKIVHVVVYLVVSLRLLQGFNQKLKYNLASLAKVKLEWLRILLYAFAGWMIFTLVLIGFVHIGGYYYLFHQVDTMATTGVIAIIFLIGFMSIRQPEIISGEVVKIEKQSLTPIKASKYQKTGLSTEKTKALYEQLKTFMETEKPYLDNEITLAKLSQKMTLSPHQLSQVINEQAKKNFYDFINAYRVAQAQRLLLTKEYAEYTILHIAYESGFKNKNSFNRAFKKMTQMTPSEFKANHKGVTNSKK